MSPPVVDGLAGQRDVSSFRAGPDQRPGSREQLHSPGPEVTVEINSEESKKLQNRTVSPLSSRQMTERSSTVVALETRLAPAASKVTSWAVALCFHGTTSWMEKVRPEASAQVGLWGVSASLCSSWFSTYLHGEEPTCGGRRCVLAVGLRLQANPLTPASTFHRGPHHGGFYHTAEEPTRTEPA